MPDRESPVPDLNRYLQIRSSGGAVLTADGRRLVLVANLSGLPHAWSVPAGAPTPGDVHGCWPHQVTVGDERVQWVAASPVDPEVVVFGRDAGGNERTQLHRVTPTGLREEALTAAPGVIHRFGGFTPDGGWVVYTANGRDGVSFDLYRGALASASRVLVARLEGSQHPADVTPDGSGVVVVRAHSLMDADLTLVDLRSAAVRTLAAGGRHRPGGFGDDGRHLFVASDAGRDHLAGTRIDVATGACTLFGPDDRDVDDVAVAAGTGALAVNEGGRSRLCWFDPATLALTGHVELPVGVAGDLCVAPDGGGVTFTFSGAARPPAVWRAAAGAVHAEPLTEASTAGVDPRTFVTPSTEHVESFDGLRVPMLVYRPAGVARPPVVVSVHGGPESQERPTFKPVYQYLLARGIAVVAPNVRGSTGYGRSYAALDDGPRRRDAVADLDAVAGWAAAEFDGARLAVMGASYGGFMTLSALAAFPDRFAAGVDVVGMADLVTFLERTGDYRRALREAEYGSLATDRPLLRALSPLTRVDAITAPLLVIHGANDPRVPVSEAEQIVERLRGSGHRDVEYLRFEDEGHGIVRLDNRVVAYTAVADFLERHLR